MCQPGAELARLNRGWPILSCRPEMGLDMPGWLRTQRRISIGTAVAAALVLVTGATSAPAGAATGPWQISTLAGGVGGPGPGSQIAGGECAGSFAGGYLY